MTDRSPRGQDFRAPSPEAGGAVNLEEEHRRMANELAATKAKLRAANDEVIRLHERARAVDEHCSQLFANLGHELRTPLTLILGPLERLVAQGGIPGDTHRDLDVAARNARTLLKHVNDLLDTAKLEAGKAVVHRAPVDIAEIVRTIAAHFDGVAREREMRFVVDAPEPLVGKADAEKVQRVLLNLISNAFKFAPEHGTVRCSARRAPESTAVGAAVRIEVADSGAGVPPSMRARVFERFAQADGGVDRCFGGTGLGLTIAKDLVDLHGGRIEIGDAPEGGALFTVHLPLPEALHHRAQATAPRTEAPRDALAENSAADAAQQVIEELGRTRTVAQRRHHRSPRDADRRPTALVVEDNADMNRFVRETLGPEWRTVEAVNGPHALAELETLRPDLIVSDIMMGGMSGDELVRRVRERAELDTVPILVLTAKTDDVLRVAMLRQGAQDYVLKPFSPDELRARAMNLFRIKRARDTLQAELQTQNTDLDLLADQLALRARELRAALDVARTARANAERASRVKSNFLCLVSHELYTPLTTLRLQVDRLARGRGHVVEPRQRAMVERMSGSTARLIALVDALLERARIDSDGLVVHFESFDAVALAGDVAEMLRPQSEAKGLTLFVDGAAGTPPLRSDFRMMELVLSNLVANAVKFTETGGVRIEVACKGGRHRIAVTDSGPGIAHDELERLFQPFEQLEEISHKHQPGVGLGLALVRDMLTELGGTVQVESAPGRGSTFVVELPSTPPVSGRTSKLDRAPDRHRELDTRP